jgi:c-di-GMP-binding flagellar brake protein YcgR
MASTRSGRKARAERRRAPRADIKVPLKIKRARDVIVGSTKNISASGAYCMLNTFVPLNTKLNVTLLIPKAGRGQSKKVQCHGIVVRNQPEREGGAAPHYNTAIFFTDIDQRDQRVLSDYVKHRLSPEE